MTTPNATRERPILFSAPMVRAILNGTKTQTRRVMSVQVGNGWEFEDGDLGPKMGWIRSSHPRQGRFGAFIRREFNKGDGRWQHDLIPCPYGQPGDRLWVRESYSGPHSLIGHPPRDWLESTPIWYWADGNPTHGDWMKPKPPMHLPRWASRITLEITGVRVERLCDISESDAAAEGVNFGNTTDPLTGEIDCDAAEAFERLWESINGAGSWDANPWVWVVEFRRLP